MNFVNANRLKLSNLKKRKKKKEKKGSRNPPIRSISNAFVLISPANRFIDLLYFLL